MKNFNSSCRDKEIAYLTGQSLTKNVFYRQNTKCYILIKSAAAADLTYVYILGVAVTTQNLDAMYRAFNWYGYKSMGAGLCEIP
jgi:hypothetical protein